MENTLPRSIYVAFDAFPAPKGAAVHIREFSQTLFDILPPGLLLTLKTPELPSWQLEEKLQIRRLVSQSNNFLQRTIEFSKFVGWHIEMLKDSLQIAHFRDPWGGLPIVRCKNRKFKTVFEVNALPSIELPYKYPSVSRSTLEKIRNIELECLEKSDMIVCPSQTTKKFLESLGTNGKRIEVIYNGADLPVKRPEKPPQAPDMYLFYSGTIQPWQGLEVLFKAMQFLRDFSNLTLVLCVSGNKPRLKYLQKLAEKMGINERLIWNLNFQQSEVHRWLSHAAISVAPLVECSRNIVQGCCPLKIIESMAYAIPVIASDLPVVRELITHQKEGWLIRPDRPAELARAIRVLLNNYQHAKQLGIAAQKLVSKRLTWQYARQRLQRIYLKLS